MSELPVGGTPLPGKTRKRVVLRTALFLCIVLSLLYGWLMLYGHTRGPVAEETKVVVDIPKGTSVRGIGHILGDAKVIHDDIRFVLLAKLQGVSARLKAGEFQLPTGKTPVEVLKLLIAAKPFRYTITIPEGLSAEEVAGIFSSQGWCDPYVFEELLVDHDFIVSLGFSDITSLEGYLFPDTYFLTRDMRGSEKILTMMVARFQKVWEELVRDRAEMVSQRDTIILASIVEKETGASAERPLIASVFRNRLKKGMRLQSDPTVIYGISRFNGNITKTDLRTPSPYNTYLIPALPAGPIANPGKASLQAVLQPADGEYLYFVSKNDGTHQFSATLQDHNLAVRKYQRKNNDKDGKE